MMIFAKIAHNFDPLRLSIIELTGIPVYQWGRFEYILVPQLLTGFFTIRVFYLLYIMPSGRKVHILYQSLRQLPRAEGGVYGMNTAYASHFVENLRQ